MAVSGPGPADTHGPDPSVNLPSELGLHRRWRGAILGHLTVLEMDSSIPTWRYGDGLCRLGFDAGAIALYDEHVLVDAVHEQVAAVDMYGSFVAADPTPLAAEAVDKHSDRTRRTRRAPSELGCRILALDVADERSMAAAVNTVVGEQGRVDVLVNMPATPNPNPDGRDIADGRPAVS